MEPSSPLAATKRATLWTVVFAGGMFGLVLLLQWHSGAYQSEFGADADEPAHVVTGLMVRDYLAEGLWQGQAPMAFAEAYYDRYPKVALGHYPPAFYVVEGLWLLPVRSPAAVLLLMAFLCTIATLLTWRLARYHGLAPTIAWLPAVLFALHPLVRTYTSIVMSDLLLIIFCLLAIDAWRRFLGSTKARDSLWFGLWAAAAILTKGSGLFLAFVPPLSIALTAKWRLLKCPALWLAVVPVVLFAIPWMLATRHITAEGMSHTPFNEYLLESLRFFGRQLPYELGWLACLLLIAAGIEAVLQAVRRRPKSDSSACLISLVLGLQLLYLVVPSGLDARYLLPLVPVVYILGIDSTARCSAWITSKLTSKAAENGHRQGSRTGAVCVTVIALVFVIETQRPVSKHVVGYAAAIDAIVADQAVPAAGEFIDVLIASDANGEGAVTVAAAFRPDDPLKIHRSSKVLVATDWLGRSPKLLAQPGEETRQLLRRIGIEWILLDEKTGLPQVDLMRQSIERETQTTIHTITFKFGNARRLQRFRVSP